MATTTIPEGFHDLLSFDNKCFAYLATIMPDGTPQVTPVWFDYVGGKIRINTARGRVKDKNLRRNPNVAIAISDPKNPYRYLQIRGKAGPATEEGADDVINRLAKKYIGQDVYPWKKPGEVRVTYDIEILSTQTMS